MYQIGKWTDAAWYNWCKFINCVTSVAFLWSVIWEVSFRHLVHPRRLPVGQAPVAWPRCRTGPRWGPPARCTQTRPKHSKIWPLFPSPRKQKIWEKEKEKKKNKKNWLVCYRGYFNSALKNQPKPSSSKTKYQLNKAVFFNYLKIYFLKGYDETSLASIYFYNFHLLPNSS